MSNGPPYRYEQSSSERNRTRFGPLEARREMGSPYKRLRRSSMTDFTTFSYDDMPVHRHQEVGLGNFNDFSAISRDTVLDRESKREEKPAASEKSSSLSIQTSNPSRGNNSLSVSKATPLSVKVHVSPTPHSPVKMPTSQKTGSLLSSFQTSEHRFSSRPYSHQQSPPYKAATKSPMQLSPRMRPNHSSSHNTHSNSYPMSIGHTVQSTGLLIQASPLDAIPSFTQTIPGTPTKDEVYQPKVEAVSPSNSEHEAERNAEETPKEVDKNRTNELLKHMEKVDKEIAEVEKKIGDLKEKQKSLKEELSWEVVEPDNPVDVDHEEAKEEENEEANGEETVNGAKEEDEENSADLVTPQPREKTLIERIYEENRKKAFAAHQQFAKLGIDYIPLANSLPKYNQPSDLPFYEENRKNAKAVKLVLIKYFQRKRREKSVKQHDLLEEYRDLEKKWLEKVEKLENNPKRKAKELRVRDFYEKIFPEIKRQREQTERFSRLGSRANWGLAARSEAEYNEILKDLTEKETHEKHMRDLAVDPPPLLDEDQKRVKFINKNGLIKDLKSYVNERKMINVWTEKEIEIFKEKYIAYPKDFKCIASFLENKSIKDCVLYYYRTKRSAKYKKLARKQSLKRKRFSHPNGKEDGTKSKILKPRTEGYRSESDIDDEEGFDEDSDGSEESSSRINVSTSASANHSARIITSHPGGKPEPVETPRWSKSEREVAIEGLRCHGRNWTAIAQMVMTKTDAQCKNFYFNYKKKLDLESVVAQFNASQVQRQESEETISASEVSDDGGDGHNEEKMPGTTKPKQATRETRSQRAERREEPTPGPSLRQPCFQRSLRSRPHGGAKTCVLPRNRTAREMPNPDTKSVEREKTTIVVGTAGSDEGRIVVDDIEEHESNPLEVLVKNMLGSHSEHVSPVESHATAPPVSSSVVSTASLRISDQPRGSHTATSLVENTSLPERLSSVSAETRRQSTPIIHRTSLVQTPASYSVKTNVSLPPSLVTVDVPRPMESPTTCFANTSTTIYPNVPFRPYHVETHAEALQKLAKTVASSGIHGENKLKLEESEEAQQEKVKFQRVPDPQLPKVEQKEAIGIFSRYSPCISPDTTSRQRVRTQRFPPLSLHSTSPLVPQFVPPIRHHAGHFPTEMYPVSVAPGLGFPMYPHPIIEYLQHPGMDPEHLGSIPPYSARLMEEAAMHHAHSMWSHFDRRGIIVGPHPTFMMANEMNRLTPPEITSRIRESPGHDLNLSAPSKRCRSVEAAVMHSGIHSPENNAFSEVRPASQQRSSSLTDVHSCVTGVPDERRASPFHQAPKTSPRLSQSPTTEHVPDQIQSYEPFTALMNVAAGATPMMSGEEPGRAQRQHDRKTPKAAPSEVERAQMHFTRHPCVVTNTSVIQTAPFDLGMIEQHLIASDRPRYGISTGLVPKPPPLMPITGIRAQALARQALSPDPRLGEVVAMERTPLFGMTSESARGHDMVNPCPGISQKLEARGSRATLTSPPPPYCLNSPQQHPPPLVRNTPPLGAPERRVLSPFPDIMVCGCRRGNEPCKHQLYSQEVPYVSRGDVPARMMLIRHENDPIARTSSVGSSSVPMSARETASETSTRGSTHLFRPWMENYNMEKEAMNTSAKTSPVGMMPSSHIEHSDLLWFTSVASSTNPVQTSMRPTYRGDQRGPPWTSGPLESGAIADPPKSLRTPYNPTQQTITSAYQDAFKFGLVEGKDGSRRSRDCDTRSRDCDTRSRDGEMRSREGDMRSRELLPLLTKADAPVSSSANANNPPHSVLSFHTRPGTLPPSLSRESIISVEAGIGFNRSHLSDCERASAVESSAVSSSEEGLGRTSSDQRTERAATESDLRSDVVESSPEGVSSDDEDWNYPPVSAPSCGRVAEDEEDWDGTSKEPTGSRDPGEPTSCCSSSESEAIGSSTRIDVTPWNTGRPARHEFSKTKKFGDESSGEFASIADCISTTSQSEAAFGDNSSADDHVVSSQSFDPSCVQPAVPEQTVSGNSIRQRPIEERTSEESENESLGIVDDKVEMRDDGDYNDNEVMSGLEEGQVASSMEEDEVGSCVKNSEDMGQGEVVSGAEGDLEDVTDKREGGEVPKEVKESEGKILQDINNDGEREDEESGDIEGGGAEVEDKMSDHLASSTEHVDMGDSECSDGMLGGIEWRAKRHVADDKEDEVVSGNVRGGVEVGSNEGRLGIGCNEDEDVLVLGEGNEDDTVIDEVRSSDEILKKEHEAIESDDELEGYETNDVNKKEGEEEEETKEKCARPIKLMDIDETSETSEDNENMPSTKGTLMTEEKDKTSEDNENVPSTKGTLMTEEKNKTSEDNENVPSTEGTLMTEEKDRTSEDNENVPSTKETLMTEEKDKTSEDKEELEEPTVDTTDTESNVNTERESEKQDDAVSEKDTSDAECLVSSASQSDRVAAPPGGNNVGNESEYLSTGEITGSDERESATMGYCVIAESSSHPTRSLRRVSDIDISKKCDDEVSTSTTSSWPCGPAHGNESPGSTSETSEAHRTLDRTATRYRSAVDAAPVDSVGCPDDGRAVVDTESETDLGNDATGVECSSDEPTTTNREGDSPDERRAKAWEGSDVSETTLSGNEAESSVTVDEGRDRTGAVVGEASGDEMDVLVDSSTALMVSSSEDTDVKGICPSSTDQEDMLGTSDDSLGYARRNSTEEEQRLLSTPANTRDIDGSLTCDTRDIHGSPICVSSAGAELQKYGHFEEISSDEECSELEEGEIAETPGDTLVQSSGSYYPPLDTIPISPPGSDDCEISGTAFLEWGRAYTSPSTQPPAGNANEPSNELASGSRAAHSVPFPYSALNVRSASNSNCSSPVPLGFVSGCSTPVIFQREDSNNTLSGHYEPLSDDENGEGEATQTLSESDSS